MMHKMVPGGRLVGLSNAGNRPKVDGLYDIYTHVCELDRSISGCRLAPS